MELVRTLGRLVNVPEPEAAALTFWKLPREPDLVDFLVSVPELGMTSSSMSRFSIVCADPVDMRLRRRDDAVSSISSAGCECRDDELRPGCTSDCANASRAGKGVRLRTCKELI